MKCQAIAILILVAVLTPEAYADGRRFIVALKIQGVTVTEHILWRDADWPKICLDAVTYDDSPKLKELCQNGFGSGKPRIGILRVGDEVEVIQSRQCNYLSYIRVLTGKLKSETGCVLSGALSTVRPAEALSSIKPQIQTAPILPKPDTARSPVSGKSAGPRQGSLPARSGSATIDFINRVGRTVSCPSESADSAASASCVSNAESQGYIKLPAVSAGLSLDWNSKPVKIVQVRGAAAEAGVRAGDVLVEIDGNKIVEAISAFKVVDKKRPGDYVIINVARSGKPMNFTYRLTGR